MSESRGRLDRKTILPGGCFAKWNEDLRCPNEWTGVIENIREPGYGQFCAVHMEGYQRFNPAGEGVSWKAWTRDEWEASGRAAEHEAKLT
jgi:hypothetical protein